VLQMWTFAAMYASATGVIAPFPNLTLLDVGIDAVFSLETSHMVPSPSTSDLVVIDFRPTNTVKR
jgi:hypothetical protein